MWRHSPYCNHGDGPQTQVKTLVDFGPAGGPPVSTEQGRWIWRLWTREGLAGVSPPKFDSHGWMEGGGSPCRRKWVRGLWMETRVLREAEERLDWVSPWQIPPSTALWPTLQFILFPSQEYMFLKNFSLQTTSMNHLEKTWEEVSRWVGLSRKRTRGVRYLPHLSLPFS